MKSAQKKKENSDLLDIEENSVFAFNFLADDSAGSDEKKNSVKGEDKITPKN